MSTDYGLPDFWFNVTYVFANLTQDGEAYAYLLNVLAPEHCNPATLDAKDPNERAKLVLDHAERMDCKRYLSPKDIVEGSSNLNLAFVAQIFHQRFEIELHCVCSYIRLRSETNRRLWFLSWLKNIPSAEMASLQTAKRFLLLRWWQKTCKHVEKRDVIDCGSTVLAFLLMSIMCLRMSEMGMFLTLARKLVWQNSQLSFCLSFIYSTSWPMCLFTI